MVSERLGFPKVGAARPFVLATLVDALGSGLFLPFSVLYFHHAGGLPLADAGLGLSIAMLAALPAPLLGGSVVDRVGPKRTIVASSAARAVGFLLYLPVHQALTTALRCTGLGLGGLLAGIAVSRVGTTGYYLLTIANAASFAASTALLVRLPVPPRPRGMPAIVPAGFRGIGTVLADRPFCGVVLANLAFGVARTALLVGVPIYTVQVLKLPAWLAGMLYAEYTALIAIGQTSMVRRLERHRRTRVLMLAACIWAAAFLLMAGTPALPHPAVGPFIVVVAGVYTVAVMLHVGVIDALVVEAAPSQIRGRYLAVYQLSWATATAVAPGLFTLLLAWRTVAPWIALTLLVLLAFASMVLTEPHLSSQAVRRSQPDPGTITG